MKTKISWYWNRLCCMSWQEILYRVYTSIQNNFEKLSISRIKNTPKPNIEYAAHSYISTNNNNALMYISAADEILQGNLDIATLRGFPYGIIPEWNRNPLTGYLVPLSFGKTLDYRDTEKIGDIKYLWLPNRHLQLVIVSQAYSLTKDSRYLEFIAKQLNSWFDQCPFLRGPNWTSSLELAIRLINWSLVWFLIGGENAKLFDGRRGAELKLRWLSSIYQHCNFIHSYFSRHSSANNHLLGELAGLFIATIVWPYWKESKAWKIKVQKELVKETTLQTGEDGVNREQAIFYQHFVLDFLILAGLAGRANAYEFPTEYWNRIEAMLEYLASIMDVEGNMPMIGDGDDGLVCQLSLEPDFCVYRSLLATGAVLFDRKEFSSKAKHLDDKTLWLLNETALRIFERHKSENKKVTLPIRRSYPQGGYYILGTDFENKNEVRMIVDAGPLGYPSIAAHGHADALAVIVNVAGKEFLIDPGTYVYQSQPVWREYFRSTRAHNTITVDDQSQSIVGGKFMWLKTANAQCETWQVTEGHDQFVGSHDGYIRLSDPVMHRRAVEFDRNELRFIIEDTISCAKEHQIRQYWHFSEKCNVELEENRAHARIDDTKITLIFQQCAECDIKTLKGKSDPIMGWVSRRFNTKEASSTIIITKTISTTTTLTTYLQCRP